MTERKLTKAELKELLNFIEKRGFNYVDVQMEILDHFACKVEEILTAEPELSLSQAMDKAHASFGIFGFSTIEDAYAGGINRHFFNSIPSEWVRLLKSRRGAIMFIALTAYTWLVFTIDSIDFIDGSRLGFAITFLITTIATLLQYRPLSKNYLIYRTIGGLFATLGIIFFQLLGNFSLWNLLGETGSKVLLPISFLIFGSIAMLLEGKLKQVVERVDEIELQTKYS